MKARARTKPHTAPDPARVGGNRRTWILLATLVVLAALFVFTRRLVPATPSERDVQEVGALLKAGMEQQWRGDLRGAAASFKRASARVPNWAEAHVHLGALYYEAREYDLARQELRRGVELAPENGAAWGQLGKLYLTTGAFDEAEEALQRAIQLKPDRATYPAMLGEVYRQHGDRASIPKAIAAFRQALALNPENAEAYHRLGLLYQRMGRAADAAVALSAATRFAPDLPEPYYALAQVERQLGRTASADRAMRTFRRLERRKRADQERRELGGGEGARTRGRDDGRPTTDERPPLPQWPPSADTASLRRPLAPSPTPDAAALLARGRRTFYGESQPDEAITLFQQAQQADPRHPDIPYNLGLALHFVGRLDEAEAAFRQALALDPRNPRYHAWIGTIRLERGPAELDAAIAALREAVALGPDYAYGHYQLGRAYLLKGDAAAALPMLERVVALKPRYREAYYSLGQAYLRLGRPDAARRSLATFRRLDAIERERRRLSLLARASPHDPAPRLRLARFLAANGDRAGAAHHLEGILRAFPDHPGARAELQRLQKEGFTTETRRHGEGEE